MANPSIIDSCFSYVKAVFESDYSGHDYEHTKRVYSLAVSLGKEEGADILTVSLAALLHDVDDRKLSPETYQTKEKARTFLKEHNVQNIEEIIKIIDDVSFKAMDSVTPDTIEGKVVQDADRLDALGAIGIARAFAYGGANHRQIYNPDIKPKFGMGEKEYFANTESTSINHFYEKLLLLEGMMTTGSGKKEAKRRTDFMREFLKEFFVECGTTFEQ